MLRRIVRTKLRQAENVNPKRLTRRLPNPFHMISNKKKQYGKFAYLFEEVDDPMKKYDDKLDKHAVVVYDYPVRERHGPYFATESTFVSPSATVAGKVQIDEKCSVWYGSVIKADFNLIRIEHYTNIQDNSTISDFHKHIGPDHDGSTVVGHHVTVGHSCNIRAATIEPYCLIGSCSVLMEGSYMEAGSQVAAGTVLYPGQRVPHGELWGGNPGKFIRALTEDEATNLRPIAEYYWLLATRHREEFILKDLLHAEAENQNLAEKLITDHYSRKWVDEVL